MRRLAILSLYLVGACGQSGGTGGDAAPTTDAPPATDADPFVACCDLAVRWQDAVAGLSRSCQESSDCTVAGGADFTDYCECYRYLPYFAVNTAAYGASAGPALAVEFAASCKRLDSGLGQACPVSIDSICDVAPGEAYCDGTGTCQGGGPHCGVCNEPPCPPPDGGTPDAQGI